MAVINRTLDASEQKESIKVSGNAVATGGEMMTIIERPCTLSDAKISLIGISGTPHYLLKGLRFVAGTGGSSFAIGSSFAVTAYGTSGYLNFSLPASGSSLLSLQKGDVLVLTAGGTNAAAVSVVLDLVVQNTQDIKNWY